MEMELSEKKCRNTGVNNMMGFMKSNPIVAPTKNGSGFFSA